MQMDPTQAEVVVIAAAKEDAINARSHPVVHAVCPNRVVVAEIRGANFVNSFILYIE